MFAHIYIKFKIKRERTHKGKKDFFLKKYEMDNEVA